MDAPTAGGCPLGQRVDPGPVQGRVPAAGADERIRHTVLDDAATFKHDDPVGDLDRGQPVGDDQRSATGQDGAQCALDQPLTGDVQRGGGLVEDEYRRISQECPGERDQLALAGAEPPTPLGDIGVETIGQRGDELVAVSLWKRLAIGALAPGRQVLVDLEAKLLGVFAMFGSIVYLSIYLQVVYGSTPTEAGLQLLPLMGGMLVTSIGSGLLITRPDLTQGIGFFNLAELPDTPGEKSTATPIVSGKVEVLPSP